MSRVVTGLLASTEGAIRLGGRDITGLPAYKIARAGAAHVPEGRGVFANLTVEENLKLAFRQRGGRQSVSGSLEKAYTAFPVLGERRRQNGGTLSGGEQRILSLAKVLVAPPRLLVADEISLGLAPVMIDAVYEGLRKINGAGTALLIVEQQVDRVLEIAAPPWCSSTDRWPTAGTRQGPWPPWNGSSLPAGSGRCGPRTSKQNGSAPD